MSQNKEKKIRFLPVSGVSKPGKTLHHYDFAMYNAITMTGEDYSKWVNRKKKIDDLLDSCPITEIFDEIEWEKLVLKEKENED